MRVLLVRLLALLVLLTACAAPFSSPTALPSAVSPPSPAAAPTATSVATAAPTVAMSPIPSPSASPAASAFPVTVTDDTGRQVTIPHLPRRIISLSPGHTETLYALGLGDRIVATDSYSDYPPENKPKAILKTYPRPNLEEIVALRPDLVVTLVQSDDVIHQLTAQGIPVLKLFPDTFEGVLTDINRLGTATGTAPRAEQLTESMRERARAIEARTRSAPRVRVLYELDASDPTRPFVAGGRGYYGALVPMAGGENIFADLDAPSGQVSAEQIIARDPQIILLADAHVPYNPQTPAMVKARTGWSRISAVRDGRIYPVDGDLLTRPGPRLVDGLAELARLIHPELFR